MTGTGGANGFNIGQRGNLNSTDLDILVWHPQVEDVTGQSNTNPSEYVSVGVLSAPYHGANVDGVKYFSQQNGNTVASNVVTEAVGAAIDSSTLLGYLAEGARTNLCLQSEVLDNASWTKTRSTITANAVASPDGNTTADKIVEDATAGASHQISQDITATADANYAISMFFKAGERSWVRLLASNGANSFGRYFNIGTGALGTATVAGTGANVTSSIVAYANGWYKCTIVGSVGSAVTTITLSVQMANADNGASYNGDGASGLYAWGAQFENNVSFASSYIPTTTVAVTRNADVLTYPSANNVSDSAGTSYGELSTLWATCPDAVAIGLAASFTGAQYLFSARPSTQIGVNDGTGFVTKTGLTDMNTAARKRATSWGALGMSATGDGVSVANTTFDGSMNSMAIGIGVRGDGSTSHNWFGTIRNVRLYLIQVTDGFLQAMTA